MKKIKLTRDLEVPLGGNRTAKMKKGDEFVLEQLISGNAQISVPHGNATYPKFINKGSFEIVGEAKEEPETKTESKKK